jgi:hypothetical protein
MTNRRLRIRDTLLLSVPLLVFHLGYLLNHSPEFIPTGFNQYDNVGYAAYARQYLDEPHFPLYTNPFNDGPGYQPAYFQFQNLILAPLIGMGVGPGWAILLFNALFFVLTIYLIVSIYDRLYTGSPHRNLTLWLLVWGGGLLVLAGAAALPFRPLPELELLDRLFYLDPSWGWWGLSFSRGMFAGLESYYHFLLFAVIYLLLQQRWALACGAAFLLSFSHPFTGVQLFGTVLLLLGYQKLVKQDRQVPLGVVLTMGALALLHLGYYLYFLPSHPDHRSVADQYRLNWHYRFYHFVPAYLPVFLLFAASLLRAGWRSFLASSQNQVFLALALVSLVLANHELFMTPHQPIHFTRGYEWTAYFLLGVPALHALLSWLGRRRWLLYGFTVLFLLDNFLWIINYARFTVREASTAHITAEQGETVERIRKYATRETLVVGGDETIPYLATAYTPAYAWYSHPYTTPFAAEKLKAYQQFLKEGTTPPAWKNRHLLLLLQKRDSLERSAGQRLPTGFRVIQDSKNYLLLEGKFRN